MKCKLIMSYGKKYLVDFDSCETVKQVREFMNGGKGLLNVSIGKFLSIGNKAVINSDNIREIRPYTRKRWKFWRAK